MLGERIAKGVASVVVAGHEVDGDAQVAEDLAQPLVLFGLAAVGQVAGRDDERGQRRRSVDDRDRAAQIAPGTDHMVKEIAFAPDVGVGDLRDEHDRERTRPVCHQGGA